MDMPEYMDFTRTGPGTLAGRYLRMFWHPVCRVQDLAPGRAAPIRIMSEDFTLYRGEGGAAHVVAFRCAHRGTQLSTGWVEGDSLRCRYHGWKYDGEGQCVEQPGEDEGFASKVRIRSYPTQEYLGLIFAYLGEGEAPPFKHYPDLEQPGVFEVNPPEHWPCNYFNRLDNACDAAHVGFTHLESGRRANRPERMGIRSVTAEETEYGIKTTYTLPEQPSVRLHFHMPITNQTKSFIRVEGSLEDARTLIADRLFWRVPVDDERCVSFVVDRVPLTGEAAERYRERRKEARQSVTSATLNEFGDAVVKGRMRVEDVDHSLPIYYLFWVEDYAVQVGQGPAADRSKDILGKIDRGVFVLRKIWERELKALAEGRPLKQWKSPDKPLHGDLA
jgi:5,5'-dehydrodivanillate O-demethylase